MTSLTSDTIRLINRDNTISVNRRLARILGLNAAVVFAVFVGKQAYYEKRGMLDRDGFFYSTIDDLQESTSLSRHQQQSAVNTLVEAGLVEYRIKGLPAKRCFRICADFDRLAKLLAPTEGGREGTARKGEKGESLPEKREQTTFTERGEAVFGKAADLQEEKPPLCLKESGGNTFKQNNKSISLNPNHSICGEERKRKEIEKREKYLSVIRKNIEYDFQPQGDKEKIDELVEIMLDVICSERDRLRINGEDMPAEVVKSRFLKIDSSHIEYVLTALKNNTSSIKNIRAYLITTLYNAPATIDSYYSAAVNHHLFAEKTG